MGRSNPFFISFNFYLGNDCVPIPPFSTLARCRRPLRGGACPRSGHSPPPCPVGPESACPGIAPRGVRCVEAPLTFTDCYYSITLLNLFFFTSFLGPSFGESVPFRRIFFQRCTPLNFTSNPTHNAVLKS